MSAFFCTIWELGGRHAKATPPKRTWKRLTDRQKREGKKKEEN
jgi:hypothetical protein